jgi:acyl carrier protein
VSKNYDLSISTLDVNTDLASLGVDSLMSIEIFSKLEYASFSGINLQVRSLSYCKSFDNDRANAIEEKDKLIHSKGHPNGRICVQKQRCGRSSTPKSISARTASEGVAWDIIKIVSETRDLSISTLDVNTDLASLGVDSLMSIEIFSKLEYAFPTGINLEVRRLSYCKSVADTIQEVSAALKYSGIADEAISPQSSVSSSPWTICFWNRCQTCLSLCTGTRCS